MLIKVMTNRNTERLISNVQDVDIHKARYGLLTDEELHNTLTKGPGVFNETGLSPLEIITFDSPLDTRDYGPIHSTTNISFIDYKKDGQWNRLAVECFAYICNDDGKTISKVVVE